MRRNALEWAVLAISIAGLALLVAILIGSGLARGSGRPSPVVELRTEDAAETVGGWVVPADVTNPGGASAVAVQVEATATVDGEVVVVSADIDHLPVGGVATIHLVFPGPPDGVIEARAISFREP